MNPFAYINISATDEKRQLDAFLQMLKSLSDNASSYLYQKGIVFGDASYRELEATLKSEATIETTIKDLIRAKSPKDMDDEFLALLALLLIRWSNEASQILTDLLKRNSKQSGTHYGILSLAHHMALVDRAAVFLNLPSINDRAFWDNKFAIAAPASAPSKPATAKTTPAQKPGFQKPNVVTRPSTVNKPKPISSSSADTMADIIADSLADSIADDEFEELESLSKGSLKPIQPAKINKPGGTPGTVNKATVVRSAARVTKPVPPMNKSTPVQKAPPPKPKPQAPSVARPKPAARPAQAPKTVSAPPPKDSGDAGPMKKSIKRILETISDKSFDSLIEAMEDEQKMLDLYYDKNNSVPVIIFKVDKRARKVYFRKQKKGREETVTFVHIRKLLGELT